MRGMLELYNFSQSTCSLKVRICLAEKKLEWTDRRLVSKDHDHLAEWYLKLNPNGVVPTLVHDRVPIIESSVIVQYLDDVFPLKFRSARLTPWDLRRCGPGSFSSTRCRRRRCAFPRFSMAASCASSRR
ncbi:MAG: hypothetical protein GEU95_24535 [Rhizobiales bacterium]|nr:hypothetical protein [Hyphomicrobiales bacterium]